MPSITAHAVYVQHCTALQPDQREHLQELSVSVGLYIIKKIPSVTLPLFNEFVGDS